jgi:hypothetical protein
MLAMDWSSRRDICSVHSKSLMLRPPRFKLKLQSTRSRLDSLRRRTRHPIPPLPALPRIGRSRKMKRARQDTALLMRKPASATSRLRFGITVAGCRMN